MESRDMEHADGPALTLAPSAKPHRRKRETPAARADAALRQLIDTSTFDLALFFTSEGYVLFQRAGKEIKRKEVRPEMLRAAFIEEPVDSGWLPADIMRCGTGLAGPFAVKFVPPGTHTLHIETSQRAQPLAISVPLPALVFAGVGAGRNEGFATYYVWAIKENTFGPQAELSHAPLANVYAEGRICYGENHPPAVVSRENLEQAWQLFITSVFTGSAASNKSRKYPEDVRQLLLTLQDAERFPAQDLCPFSEARRGYYSSSPRITTVEDAVAYYILQEDPQ